MKYIFSLLCLLVPTASFAANSGGSSSSGGFHFGKGSSAWVIVGAGPISPNAATKQDVAFDSRLTLRVGGDLSIVGPVFLTAAINVGEATGTIKYNYTDSSNNTYSAQNVSITQNTSGLNLGLQIRLINSPNIHIFVEGGGFAEAWTMSYDFTAATNTSGSATPENSQSTITSLGTYASAGIDFLMTNGYGLRLLGRAAKGSTSKIDALNGAKISYVDGEGYLGFIKQF